MDNEEKYDFIKKNLPHTWDGVADFLECEYDVDIDNIDRREITAFKEYLISDLAKDYQKEYVIDFETAYDICERAIEDVDRLLELTKINDWVAFTNEDYKEFLEQRNRVGNEVFRAMGDALS